jgi:hypothetical protein
MFRGRLPWALMGQASGSRLQGKKMQEKRQEKKQEKKRETKDQPVLGPIRDRRAGRKRRD